MRGSIHRPRPLGNSRQLVSKWGSAHASRSQWCHYVAAHATPIRARLRLRHLRCVDAEADGSEGGASGSFLNLPQAVPGWRRLIYLIRTDWGRHASFWPMGKGTLGTVIWITGLEEFFIPTSKGGWWGPALTPLKKQPPDSFRASHPREECKPVRSGQWSVTSEIVKCGETGIVCGEQEAHASPCNLTF